MNEPLIWAEVDLAAYGHNIGALKGITRPGARLMAVVKADGYGHGAVPVARVALAKGADWLGVARIEEAVELREAGLEVPILIFGPTSPDKAEVLLDHDLAQTVFSPATAATLSERVAATGKKIRTHIKVDTGMGRLGLLVRGSAEGASPPTPAERRVSEVEAITSLPGLEVEGLFTHFASADHADKVYANRQLQRFTELINGLHQRGLEFPLNHAANSAALIDMPDSHLDMVRPGIATYGLYPSAEVEKDKVDLRPVLQWKTRIIQLKEVPAGFGVSYGITYRTPRPTTIATVAAGYADGLNRLLPSRGHMLVGGHRVPIVGRICMDLTLLDVGEVPSVEVGDEVVIIGRQGDAELTADEMATTLDTINYEIVSTIIHRVPRIYLH